MFWKRVKAAAISFIIGSKLQTLPPGRMRIVFKWHYFIVSLLVSCLFTFYVFRITHSIWKSIDPNDEESIFSPFTFHKVPFKLRNYITNQPAPNLSLHPKLYYPRHCPDTHATCAKPVPSFIIAGSELSGASSIFQLLKEHPQVSQGSVDHSNQTTVFNTMDYFDEGNAFERYMDQFPFADDENQDCLVGELAPQYLYSSNLAAKRIKETLPQVKIVFFLRDPIIRAYLQYLKEYTSLKNKTTETNLSFEDLIDLELSTLRRCGYTSYQTGWEGFIRCHQGSEIRASWKTFSDNYTFNSLAKGIYYPALQPFLYNFPSSQLFVMKIEDVLRDPAHSLERLAQFLGIDPAFFSTTLDLETANQPKLATQYRLQKVFRGLNKRLVELFDVSSAPFEEWTYDIDRG